MDSGQNPPIAVGESVGLGVFYVRKKFFGFEDDALTREAHGEYRARAGAVPPARYRDIRVPKSRF